jgi:ribonucleoside-diphosphate reductase beta chain
MKMASAAVTSSATWDHQVFHFTRELMRGPIYRKYEKAVATVWNPRDIDYAPDAEDWQRLSEDQRRGLLGITTRFFAGEQTVTNELMPMIAGAQALGRYDWVMYLSTFMMEEAKHSQFFALWHDRVTGLLEPEELEPYFLHRGQTKDPTGRFQIGDVVNEGLPRYGAELMEAVASGERGHIERQFARFATLYNGFAEGVLTMPSYEIVIDTCRLWDGFPALTQGFRRILADEGRHITFGTTVVGELVDADPSLEPVVHAVFDEWRGNAVGLVEYQKSVPGLDVQKYQSQKVRHYRNRCREMHIGVDETIVDQMLDPSIDFVVGVEAG